MDAFRIDAFKIERMSKRSETEPRHHRHAEHVNIQSVHMLVNRHDRLMNAETRGRS